MRATVSVAERKAQREALEAAAPLMVALSVCTLRATREVAHARVPAPKWRRPEEGFCASKDASVDVEPVFNHSTRPQGYTAHLRGDLRERAQRVGAPVQSGLCSTLLQAKERAHLLLLELAQREALEALVQNS